MPRVRAATQQDAAELARIAERTFRDTYAAANTVADMDLHAQLNYGELIQSREIADPSSETLVCEVADTMVGFAQLRWELAPGCVIAKEPAEIRRLYVDGAWHGKGVGPLLMQASLQALRTHGSDVVWLGVWERNPRAIAFYQKAGFVEVGDHRFELGGDSQRDIIMARPVGAELSDRQVTGR